VPASRTCISFSLSLFLCVYMQSKIFIFIWFYYRIMFVNAWLVPVEKRRRLCTSFIQIVEEMKNKYSKLASEWYRETVVCIFCIPSSCCCKKLSSLVWNKSVCNPTPHLAKNEVIFQFKYFLYWKLSPNF
jgi:hypothetical protein